MIVLSKPVRTSRDRHYPTQAGSCSRLGTNVTEPGLGGGAGRNTAPPLGLGHFEDLPPTPRAPAADRETLRLVEDNCTVVAGERFKRSKMCSTKDRAATILPLGLAPSAGVARTVGRIVPRRPERFRNKFEVHSDLGRSLLALRLCGIIAVLGARAPSPEGR